MRHKGRNYSGKVASHDYEEQEYHEVCVCRLGAKMPDEKHKNGQCEIALSHCKLCKEGIKFLESTVTHECTTSLSVKISWSAMPDYSKNQNIQSVSICWKSYSIYINPLNPKLNPICYLLALLGAHHFLHVSRIRVKLLTLR